MGRAEREDPPAPAPRGSNHVYAADLDRGLGPGRIVRETASLTMASFSTATTTCQVVPDGPCTAGSAPSSWPRPVDTQTIRRRSAPADSQHAFGTSKGEFGSERLGHQIAVTL